MHQTTKKIAIRLIAVLFSVPFAMQAQDSAVMKSRTFQVSFITPLGSNGLESWNVTNKISVNLLAGYAGGVDGVEFSGLGVVLQGNMIGAQFAGLGNIVLGGAKGAQFAGLANINSNTTVGIQMAGLVNYAPGVRVSQVSGFANVIPGNNKGLQLAGFVNVNSGRLSGTQISGFFNYAGKLKGVQLGVINYVDSLEKGVPVGFLSFVKNGYTAFEIGTTETLYGVMSFKTGTRQLYNILSVGGGSLDGISLFAWGYGLGAYIPVGKKAGVSIDGICYQVNEGEWFTDRLNLLNKLNVSMSWKFADHLAIFGGISWNAIVSDITDEYGDLVVPNIAPWSVFDETYDDHINVKMYPGFSAGIRF
jgi:hypothetical protein